MSDAIRDVLLTDLYQLSMLRSYQRERMGDIAVFEFFVRRLPEGRNFLIAAGMAQVADFLEQLRFTDSDLEWLKRTGRYDTAFLGHLAQLRFTGDVDAMPEGTPFFPDEPVIRVTAPLPEAQLVESRLINISHYQTLVASKAARCVLAAPGKLLVDFGMRRAHGAEAALFAARASYLAGFTGTATVAAERIYGVPAFGTMAHSYIQAHASEAEAFEHFAEAQLETTLLIDTYDTLRGVERLIGLLPALRARGIQIGAVRLDSGDLAALSRGVRERLDAAGARQVRIFCSGGLDEYSIDALLKQGAPIDGFGVGTALTVSADVPALDCAYKLQEYAGVARRKRSSAKSTWPGRKQVYRHYEANGRMIGDTVALTDEHVDSGEALLRPLLRMGRRVDASDLAAARRHCAQQLLLLPEPLRRLQDAEPYPVTISAGIHQLAERVDKQFS